MVILRTRNKITDFLMILAWASPFNETHPGAHTLLGSSVFRVVRFFIPEKKMYN